MGVFEQAVANIAYLRAQTGGGMSRLNFAAESLSSMETNMRAAIGRVEDVDIAAESAKPRQVLNPNPSICRHGGPGQHHQRCGPDATEIRGNSYANGNLMTSMTRDPDRMSPVLRSMITDDHSTTI